MRDYNRKQRWAQNNDDGGMPVTGLMPGATPGHIVQWGPGVNVTLRAVAYTGGQPTDCGKQPHRLHRAGKP